MHDQPDANRVFVHGAGRRGTDAWPTIDTSAGRFVSFAPEMTMPQQTAHLGSILTDAQTILFAHSIGAVPAVLAASSVRAGDVALVLVEPALYDIARGDKAIERHIAVVTEARSLAANGDLRGFWGILRPLMFGGPLEAGRWETERPIAEHWSTTNVPWGHGVRAEMLDNIPALIVTGGWNEEYELIATRVAARGSSHVVLPGAAHRAQDLPEFGDVVRAFETTLR